MRRGDEAGRARHRAREVPDDVAAAGHEESREGDEGRNRKHVGHALGGIFQSGHEMAVKHVGQDQERDDRAEGQSEHDLLLDPLTREGRFPLEFNVHRQGPFLLLVD